MNADTSECRRLLWLSGALAACLTVACSQEEGESEPAGNNAENGEQAEQTEPEEPTQPEVPEPEDPQEPEPEEPEVPTIRVAAMPRPAAEPGRGIKGTQPNGINIFVSHVLPPYASDGPRNTHS